MILAAAFAALLTTAGPADPSPHAPPVMRVVWGDLDLETASGRDALRNRLDYASRRFCDSHRAEVTPHHVRSADFCERGMRAAAVRELPLEARRRLRTAD